MKIGLSARRARLLAPVVLTAVATPMFSDFASGQTWIGRSNSSFSIPTNWANGQVPVSSPSTQLYFTNLGHASYRAFNDLGVLTLGGITVETRTNTATFIGQDPGSAFQFADGAFARSTDQGLWRFGGVTGVVNDMRLMGELVYDGHGYGNIWFASPVTDAPGSTGRITINHNAASEIHPYLRLEGANSFTGGVQLNQGNLQIGNAGALGSGVVTANGGTFRTTTAMTVPNSIVTNSALKLRTEGSFTLSGSISGVGGVDMRSVGNIGNTVTLTAANTYTGPTVIDLPDDYGIQSGFSGISAGGITVSGSAGSIVNSSRYDVRNGGVLQVNNVAGVVNRLNDTAPVHLVNGRITAVGNTTAGNLTTERVGNMTIDGMGILFINGGNGGVTLSTPALTREDRATLMLTLGNANSRFEVDAPPPPMINGVVPWIGGISGTLIASPRDVVTYENGGYRTLTAAEYADNLNAGPTANVKLTSTVANNDVVDINSLVVGTSLGTNVAITGTGTIRPASGAVVLVGNLPIENNIDFGTAEGIIHVGNIAIIDGVISGSNGLTKSGDFSLTTSAAHTYTGPTHINSGGFRFSHPNTFDTTSGFVNRTAGGGELVPSLDYRGTGTAVINKPAHVASGAFRLGANVGDFSNGLVYSGVISGPGEVHLENGNVTLTADNTHTGGTRFVGARVVLNRDSNLGAPGKTLTMAGNNIITLTGDWNSDRKIRLLNISTLNTGAHNVTWNGDIESSSSLNKFGSGIMRLNGYGFTTSAAAWTVGGSAAAQQGGRVEIDGDTRMNWSVWNGVLAVNGTVGRTSVFNFEPGSVGMLAPGDIGGPGVGTMDAFFLSLARGTTVFFDIGALSDLIIAQSQFSRGSGTGQVLFDFRVGPGIAEETYTLVDYFENPAAGSTFDVADFAFASDLEGFDGFFNLIETPQGTRALTFTVTVVPEPASLSLIGVAAITLLSRHRRDTRTL